MRVILIDRLRFHRPPGCQRKRPTMRSLTTSFRPARRPTGTAAALTGLALATVMVPAGAHAAARPGRARATGMGRAGAQAEARPGGELTLYTTREVALVQPLLSAFTARTGTQVNPVFVKDGLLERVKAEGARSPADLLMTVDVGNLVDLVEGGVTQPLKSAEVEAAVPAHLRGADGQWTALSMRARVLYADQALKAGPIRYEDLAAPKWKGQA